MKLVLCSTVLLVAGVLAEKESAEDSSQKPVRINWLPVCDSDQKAGDAKKFYHNSNSSVYFYPKLLFPTKSKSNIGACDAPNGLGMNNLIRQASKLLPRERIRSIIQGASQDPEVQALYQLVTTPEYRQLTANLSRSREYNGFRRFICYSMNCDIRLYNDFMTNLLRFTELGQATKEGDEVYKGRPGLHGVLADIRDALPRQQLRDLFERLWATDWYLIRAVQTAQSYEFEARFQMMQRNPDYTILRRALIKVGFSILELKKLTLIALGWRTEAFNTIDDLFIHL